MGSGLSGGPLTGQPVTAALPPAPAGTSAVLSGPLGAGASDVVTKIGSTVADASVNATAKLDSIRTGIGGTEVEYAFISKTENFSSPPLHTTGGPSGLTSGAHAWIGSYNGTTVAAVWLGQATPSSTNYALFSGVGSGTTINAPGGEAVHFRNGSTVLMGSLGASGRLDLYGTDSTGTPGNATINKGTGKSSIALGAASVTITNSLCTAASRVMITPHARDATCVELIAVPGAGSFVVSGAAAATADLPFSWEVSNIL